MDWLLLIALLAGFISIFLFGVSCGENLHVLRTEKKILPVTSMRKPVVFLRGSNQSLVRINHSSFGGIRNVRVRY